MIGWEDDHNTVGPVAAAAKQSLLRLIPYIMPTGNTGDEESLLYRFVIDHGDFGVHNISIAMDANNQPLVTALYDWETGCIVPAILSDPLMAVTVDLVTDEDAKPALTRLPCTATADELEQIATWPGLYLEVGFHFLQMIHVSNLIDHANNRNIYRPFSSMYPNTSAPSRLARTRATSGSHCETGAATSLKSILAIWEPGLRRG